jgi:hypothetical protein
MTQWLERDHIGPRLPDEEPLKSDGEQFAPDLLVNKIKTDYTMKNGRQKRLEPDGRTVAYKSDDYELGSDQERRALDRKLAVVREVVSSLITPDNLPRDIVPDLIPNLIENLSQTVSGYDLKDLTKILSIRAKNWIKTAKVAYVENRIANNYDVNPKDMAEAIV